MTLLEQLAAEHDAKVEVILAQFKPIQRDAKTLLQQTGQTNTGIYCRGTLKGCWATGSCPFRCGYGRSHAVRSDFYGNRHYRA
jgi:hypothetical protein